ncbi:MAG: hypothetical protein M3O82_10040 [Verrucomicrobiota bacterium]|nr:hypothetical protein [Verrucomicrobiota bacterium]
MEQLLIILLAGGLALANWILKRQSEKRERLQDPPELSPRRDPRPVLRPTPVQTEEERMRKFLEALGVPAGASPPARARPVAMPKPIAPVAPQRRFVVPTPPVVIAPSVPQTVEQTASFETETMEGAAAHALEAGSAILERAAKFMPAQLETTPKRPKPAISEKSSIRTLLGNPRSLRQAVVLREILGPPRGLQTGFPLPNVR